MFKYRSVRVHTSLPPMPLPMAKPGQIVSVAALAGGGEYRSRLLALGLIPGVEVSLLQDTGCGPMIVRIHGSRLALDRDLAERVLIASQCV